MSSLINRASVPLSIATAIIIAAGIPYYILSDPPESVRLPVVILWLFKLFGLQTATIICSTILGIMVGLGVWAYTSDDNTEEQINVDEDTHLEVKEKKSTLSKYSLVIYLALLAFIVLGFVMFANSGDIIYLILSGVSFWVGGNFKFIYTISNNKGAAKTFQIVICAIFNLLVVYWCTRFLM